MLMKRAYDKSPTVLLSLGVLLEPELGKHGCETLTCSSTKNSKITDGKVEGKAVIKTKSSNRETSVRKCRIQLS